MEFATRLCTTDDAEALSFVAHGTILETYAGKVMILVTYADAELSRATLIGCCLKIVSELGLP
jgi:hypothetical protein